VASGSKNTKDTPKAIKQYSNSMTGLTGGVLVFIPMVLVGLVLPHVAAGAADTTVVVLALLGLVGVQRKFPGLLF
jgi:tetrahydromethanopterin S-methyltransferase subunit E